MKIRLIPVLFFKDGNLVRSENFDLHQILGDPFVQVDRYNSWNVDEIIYLDISNSKQFEIKNKIYSKKKSFFDIMQMASSKCFSPIVFGGGIEGLSDARSYFQNGADKISINTLALDNVDAVGELANTFGNQSIIVSVDVKLINGHYKIYNSKKDRIYDYNLFEFVKLLEKKGAGEIFLNSVDRDGTGKGYDIDLIKKVSNCINIPLIPCGGAGQLKDFADLLSNLDLTAIAAGNIFNFTERSYEKTKIFLKNEGFNFR
jgi:cyclase